MTAASFGLLRIRREQGLACQLRVQRAGQVKMFKHRRQLFGGEALKRCILARAYLPSQELRRPLVIDDLRPQVRQLKRGAVELFEIGTDFLVIWIEPFGKWNLAFIGHGFQLLIGLVVIIDHPICKFTEVFVACLSSRESPELYLGPAACRN
ncbi:hypothetical protein A4R28_32595 (plasmid) [Mesorhizobium ciceri]|nr:hypothetical protein A4R28_32595 [Mesorhizobium ciceri]